MNLPEKIKASWLFLFFFVLYAFFPTHNSSIDAYNYAANIKWEHDLFFPHHLLYNVFHWLIYKFLNLLNFYPDVLALMKFVNSIFAVLCLIVLRKILIRLQSGDLNINVEKNELAILIFAGSSFGFMRYATENETYIIPLFLSLMASYFYLKFLQDNKPKMLFLSGIVATLSCLFHQIHLMWLAGIVISILIYKRNRLNVFVFLAPALLIPLFYYYAFLQDHVEFIHSQNLVQFFLYDYYYGFAHTSIGIDNFILGFIGFIRSFVQIHGIIPVLFKKSIFFYSVLLIACILILFSILNFVKYKSERQKPDIFVKSLIIIFILQLGFAVFSDGNAEFMVMLPILFILILNGIFTFSSRSLLFLAFAMLVWNISTGLVPNYFFDLQNQTKTISFIKKNKGSIFILSDDVLVQNINYYYSGRIWDPDIYKLPATLHDLGNANTMIQNLIDKYLINNQAVYTDCIDEQEVLSRKSYFQKNYNQLFFNDYRVQKVDSVDGFSGEKYIYQIIERIYKEQ